jgi:cellobiose phosphorylase
LFGLTPTEAGLTVAPCLPAEWGPVSLSGLPYRGATLDITLAGVGTRVAACLVDGRPGPPRIPPTATGAHTLHLTMAAH